MTRHTPSPERSGRLYYNEAYENYPAASPLAMRAISAAFMRRANLARAATHAIESIDDVLGDRSANSSPTPPAQRPESRSREELIEPEIIPHRKLGRAALASSPEQKVA